MTVSFVTGQLLQRTDGERQAARPNRENETIDGREARVGDLRRRIGDGSYHIDPAKLSAKIIDHHLAVKAP
ncbi:MAG: flagellar biosynthesis anti-sigma factor FlgM [Bryobacteraceae bacterium]